MWTVFLNGNRGGSRTAATSKMEHFVIIVYSWKPLTIITKNSIFDVAGVLYLPLGRWYQWLKQKVYKYTIAKSSYVNFYVFSKFIYTVLRSGMVKPE